MFFLRCADEFCYQSAEDVFVLDIFPVLAGLASIASDQSLCLFDPLALKQGPLTRLQTDHGNLTAAKPYSTTESFVCTAGENGSVSLWDLRQAPGVVALRTKGNQTGLLSLACSNASHTIAAGTELENHEASILLWDVRSPSAPRLLYKEIHSDDVTELTFHPSEPAIILSGSTDGLVNVCDTRIADEDEVVMQAFNHGSVHRAGFLSTTEVFAASHDEKLALYDMAESVEKGTAALDFGDVRAVLGCQYVANVAAKLNGAGAVIGAGTQDQEMFQLVHLSKSAEGWQLDRESTVGLPGAHGSEVVRSFCFLDELELAYTAGEDGSVKAWRP